MLVKFWHANDRDNIQTYYLLVDLERKKNIWKVSPLLRKYQMTSGKGLFTTNVGMPYMNILNFCLCSDATLSKAEVLNRGS